MILKIKTGNDSWVFIDGVSNLSAEQISYEVFLSTQKKIDDVVYSYYNTGEIVTTKDMPPILAIGYVSKDGTTKHEWSKTSTYLLNDEGRTIERLF